MRAGRERLVFGVDRAEVEVFVGDSYVEEFLAKFKGRRRTFEEYGRVLCMFFKWLRVVKGLSFSPEELLNEHVRKRGSLDMERRWALKLVLEFSRDNPVWSDRSDGYKYHFFTVIKGFFDYHEADLTSGNGVFGKRKKRKYKPEQASVAEVKKILGCLGQQHEVSHLFYADDHKLVGHSVCCVMEGDVHFQIYIYEDRLLWIILGDVPCCYTTYSWCNQATSEWYPMQCFSLVDQHKGRYQSGDLPVFLGWWSPFVTKPMAIYYWYDEERDIRWQEIKCGSISATVD